jgi:hypothetical protein
VRIGDQVHVQRKGNQINPLKTENTQILDIIEVSLHPNYNGITAYFDIAVVETKIVTFSYFIHPVCLPRSKLEVICC